MAEPISVLEQLLDAKRALTAKELADLLNVSPQSIWRWAASGKLPCLRIGDAVRFDPRAVWKSLQ